MQITSQKARKRANRDLQMLEKSIADLREIGEAKLDKLREAQDVEIEAMRQGFVQAEAVFARQADDIRAAMAAYDTPKGEG